MYLFELMEWFETDYVSGCQSFYAHQTNDPWHQAFEDMGTEFQTANGFDAQSVVVAKYHKVFAKLLVAYEKRDANIEYTRPWEGFYSLRTGLEGVSTKYRGCISCGDCRKPLSLAVTTRGKLPVLKCRTCKAP